jgi:hypothetical protein
MKRLINQLTHLLPSERKAVTESYAVRTLLFFLLSFTFLFSSSAMQENGNQNDDSKDKRYAVLDKLERGKSVSSEEIRSSLGGSTFNLPEEDDHFMFHGHDFYLIPPFPPIPGPFYHRHHDDDGHIIITDDDFKEIHRHLTESLEDVRKDIESFRHSDEFKKFQDELQKWNDGFRRELDKMKEELSKSAKESKSKGSPHTQM